MSRNKFKESVHVYLFELVPQFGGYFVRVLLLLFFVDQPTPFSSQVFPQTFTVLGGGSLFDGYTAHQRVLKPICLQNVSIVPKKNIPF